MKKLLFFCFLIFSQFSFAQKDLQWLKIRKYKIADLEKQVEETSALNFFGDGLYTLNDSGHPAELYELNPDNGKVARSIVLNGVENFDWEALANDGTYFYIGDIGNNRGTRTDLKIYKISVDSLKNSGKINFYYPEQKEFIDKPPNNNYDAESLVYIKGNLHLFTKEWQSYRTTHYILPLEPSEEKIPAEKVEDFSLGYVATDAAYYENRLYIVGYTKKMEVYLTVFTEDEAGKFFTQKPVKYYLGMSSSLGQIEGISVNSKGIYISGEHFKLKPFNVPQRLYFIPVEKLNFYNK